jgi:hypothetical protein
VNLDRAIESTLMEVKPCNFEKALTNFGCMMESLMTVHGT